MNLYQIASEYKATLNHLYNDETGEIDESALTLFNQLSDDMQSKGIALSSYIQNLEADRQAIEDAKKSMAEREMRLSKRITYLREYLKSNMENCNITTIDCPYFSLKIKKNPVSVEEVDIEKIPDQYKVVKQVISLDKAKIKQDLLAGIVIDGARLLYKTRLEIK
jgi:hypothetical protein